MVWLSYLYLLGICGVAAIDKRGPNGLETEWLRMHLEINCLRDKRWERTAKDSLLKAETLIVNQASSDGILGNLCFVCALGRTASFLHQPRSPTSPTHIRNAQHLPQHQPQR